LQRRCFSEYAFLSNLPNKIYHSLLYPRNESRAICGSHVLATLLKSQNWDFKTFAIIQLASLIPFGTFM
jgi:hypothetical protein